MPDWISRQLVLEGLSPAWFAAMNTAIVILAVVTIFLLHRDEQKLVSAYVGRLLLILRLAVLGLVLLVAAQPVLSWKINEQVAGRLVIGIDRSSSMTLSDPQASRGEKLRLARGLRLLAEHPRWDEWQTAWDRNEEPDWSGAADKPRRENLLAIFDQLDQIPREEIARRLLVGTTDPLLSQLQKLAGVELFCFAGTVEAIDPSQPLTEWGPPAAALQPGVTDLGIALREGPSTSTNPLLGIVLFTDGRHTASTNPIAIAQALGQVHTPIFPVLLGTEHRPKDLAIPSLEAPGSVYRGDEPLVKAMLQTSDFEGKPVTVELRRSEADESALIETRIITPDESMTRLEFQLPPAEIGRHTYLLSITPQEGETDRDNNSRSFSMTVVDDRARVLLLDDGARWEFRYLESALSRDDRVDLEVVLFDQPHLNILPETFFPRTLSATPFDEVDVVILGDVSPVHLPDNRLQLLQTFVSEQGGTLVLSSGKQYLPAAYTSPILAALTPMAELRRQNLDDAGTGVPPAQRGWRLHLSPAAGLQPMFQLTDEMTANQELWSKLPGPVWAWLGTPKPAATTWVSILAGQPTQADQALIAHHHYGFGQVVWIGCDATWRWRFRQGEQHHRQFWGQLIRWAARNKLAAGNEFVRFGPEQPEVDAGQDILLRSRWSAPFLERFPQLTAKAEILRADSPTAKPITTIDLKPTQESSLLREGRAINLPAGDYRATLVIEQGDLGPTPLETTFTIRQPVTPELMDTTSNRVLLSQLADLSGGRLLLSDELDQLPTLLRREPVSSENYAVTTLWDHCGVLLAFFTLLTGEWFLRKWHGLP